MGYSEIPVSKPFEALVDGKGRIVITSCVRKEIGIETNDIVRVMGLKRLGKNGKVPPENLVENSNPFQIFSWIEIDGVKYTAMKVSNEIATIGDKKHFNIKIEGLKKVE